LVGKQIKNFQNVTMSFVAHSDPLPSTWELSTYFIRALRQPHVQYMKAFIKKFYTLLECINMVRPDIWRCNHHCQSDLNISVVVVQNGISWHIHNLSKSVVCIDHIQVHEGMITVLTYHPGSITLQKSLQERCTHQFVLQCSVVR